MGRAKVIPPRTLLLPFQKRWVEDRSQMKLAVKARQIGWSWCAAYSIVRRKSVQSARLDAWITSRDELQAKLFVDDCNGFASLLQIGAEDLGERVLMDPEGKTASAFILRMATGCNIYSLSSNPNAQAGKRGDRIIDEAALHKDLRFLYGISEAGITWGGQMEIFSTPRGETHYFQTLIKEIQEGGNPKRFSFHKVTLQDALDQGFLYKLQQKLPKDDFRQEMDEAQYFDYVHDKAADEEPFLQEYMCVPSSDSDTFIGFDLIDGCRVRGTGETGAAKSERNKPWIKTWRSADPIGNGDLYLGMDIGRKKDLAVLWLAEDVADILVAREVKAMHRQRFAAMEAALDEYALMPRFRRGCIDASGMGMQFAERAIERHGGHRIEAVTFSGPVKEQLAGAVRAGMEDAKFRIPDDQFVVADFRKIRKTVTAAGNVRFEGERDEDGHSDRFWGAALCREAKGHGATWTFAPVAVAPDSGAGASLGMRDGFTSRRLD